MTDITQADLIDPQQPQDPKPAHQFDPGFDSLLPQPNKPFFILKDRPAPPPSTGFDAGFQSLLDDQQKQRDAFDVQLAQSISLAARTDPELAGEAQRMGIDLNGDPALIEKNMDKVREIWKRRQINARISSGGNEGMMRALLDPQFAKIALDDTENLGFIEMLSKQWNAGQLNNERGRLWDKVRAGTSTPQDDIRRKQVDDELTKMPTGTGGYGLSGFFYGASRQLGQMFDLFPEQFAAGTAGAGTALLLGQAGPQAGLPEELLSVPSMFAAGFFGAMAGQTASIEAGSAYADMRGLGIEHEHAANLATAVGWVNGLLEVAGAGIMSRPFRNEIKKAMTAEAARAFLVPIAKKEAVWKFAKEYATGVAGEVTTEVMQEISNIVAEQAGIWAQKDPSTLDLSQQQPFLERIGGIIGETLRGVALIGMPGPLMQLHGDVRRAADAERTQQWFGDLGKAIDESKVMPRNGRLFEKYLQQLSNGKDVDKVYITTEEFLARMEAAGMSREQLKEFAPEIAGRLEEAQQTGSVEIPTSTFGARFLSSDFGKTLVEHLRVDPGGASAFEAAQAESLHAKMASDAIQVMKDEQVATDTFKEQLSTEREATVQSLVKAGRSLEEASIQAQHYVNWMTVWAANMKMEPAQFARTFGLDSMSEADFKSNFGDGGGDKLFQQTDAPEFRNWFKESKAVGNDGKPIVVYHGTGGPNAGFSEFKTGSGGFFGPGGVYFTSDPSAASDFAGTFSENQSVIPAYLSIQNPFVFDASETLDMTVADLQGKGFDGIIMTGYQTTEDGPESTMYVAFDPKQIKSVNNRGTWDPRTGNALHQERVVAESAIPITVDEATKIETANELALSKKWGNVRDLKVELQAKAEKAFDAAGVKMTHAELPTNKDGSTRKGAKPVQQVVVSEDIENYIARVGFNDAMFALQQNPNAVGWYDLKTRQALAIVALLHPEVLKDADARFVFTYVLATTSNGLKVNKNFELAEKAYRTYKETGKMPEGIGIGTAAETIDDTLLAFNVMKEKLGLEKMRKLFLSRAKAGLITSLTGMKVGGESVDTVVLGAAALGPKIGNGFFANLYGNFDQLTMDRWLVRTWGRWTGTLLVERPDMIEAKSAELQASVQAMTEEGRAQMSELVGVDVTTADPELLAKKIKKASEDAETRSQMNAIEGGAKVRRDGNSLWKWGDQQKEAPSGPSERVYIRSVFGKILDQVRQQPGMAALTMADLQAVLWYAERRIYETAKEEQIDTEVDGYDDSEAPDYAVAAAKLVTSNGVSEAKVKNALKREEQRNGRTTDAQRGAGQDGPAAAGSQQTARAGFTADEVRTLGGHTAVLDARAHRRNGAEPSWSVAREGVAAGSRLRVLGARVAATFTVGKKLSKRLKQAGYNATAKLHELDSSDPQSATAFHSAIAAFKARKKEHGASVYVYDEADYRGMRLLLTPDGKSGIALKPDGDMVSVFTGEGAARLLVEVAVSIGATKADAFDIGLAELYAGHGFRVVSRTPWDESQKPANWDKTYFAEHNNGEPDVVFMAFDPDYRADYSKADGGKAVDGSLAYKRQVRAVKDLAPKVAMLRDQKLNAPTELGRYFPEIRTMVLKPDATSSTVIHEMSHHFFTMLVRMASMVDGPEQARADVDVMLQWFGIAGETPEARLGNWNTMPFEQQAPHHEAVSYNYELYAFSGVAPTSALQKIFDRMRTWMMAAYRSIRDDLNRIYREAFGRDLPMLTPEVRSVFDRMVASKDAVEAAQSMRSMLPIFQTREQFLSAGFTDAQWTEYQSTIEEAREQAVTDVQAASLRQMVWLRNAKSRVLKNLQREAKATKEAGRVEVQKEVEGEQVYLAMSILRESAAEGKLSLDEAREMIPRQLGENSDLAEAMVKKLGTGKRGLLSKDGMSLALAAEFLDYQSAGDMVRAMVAARPIDEEVELRTQKRMLEQHGELFDPQRMEDTIERALHNEARARFVAVELRFVSKATTPVAAMINAARIAAKQILGNRTVKDVRSRDFALAEARAARAAEQAMKKGDSKAAIAAKQQQLLLNQLTVESRKVSEEVANDREFFKKLSRSNARIAKERNVDVVNAARFILARYELVNDRTSDRTDDYMAMLQKADPDLFDHFKPELTRAVVDAKNWREMRVDDFRAMAETVRSMWYRAKREQEVKVGERTVRVADVVDRLVSKLKVPKLVAGETGALTRRQKLQNKLLGTRANLTKVEHYLRKMDGGEHGDYMTFLFDQMRLSLDEYRADAVVYTKKLVEMVRDLRSKGLMPEGKINAPKLNYVFGSGDGNGMAELLGALSHKGNTSNEEKFVGAGRGTGNIWADFTENGELDLTRWHDTIQSLIDDGTLKREHFDFVQGIWDLMEEIKPLLQKAHRELEGYLFKEVKARPFTIEFPDGTSKTYRGGYVPATADPDLQSSQRVELTIKQQQEEFGHGLPKVGSGFTKERIDSYRKRPLSMDINKIASHIDQAIRFAHVQPRVKDITRILEHPKFDGAMKRVDPQFTTGLMVPMLERAVTQSLYKRGLDPTVDAFWKFVRRNTGVAIMFGNVVNAMQQLGGFSNATLYVEKRHIRHALSEYLKDRRGVAESITGMSDFMDDKLNNQMMSLTSDLRELLLDPSKSAQLQAWTARTAYFLQSMAQNQVDIVTWLGSYNQSMETAKEGENAEQQQRRAVLEANSTVRLSQGSFSPEDVANYEVSTPFGRSWTQFTSYFNTVLNQISFAKGSKFKTTLVAFTIPMIFAQAIAMTMWGQWDDEDDDGHVDTAWDLLLGSQLRGAVAFVPAWGPAAAGIVEQVFSDRQFGDKVAASPAMATLTRSLLALLLSAKDAVEGKAPHSGRTVKDAITAVALLLPAGGLIAPLARPAGYLTDVATGKVRPTGAIDATLGILTGRASEASVDK